MNAALSGFGLGSNPGDTRPSAFLNYILFDQSYKVICLPDYALRGGGGWTVVPSSANYAKQQMTIPQVTVKEAGYIFVYLSYEDQSNNYVYFDDFKVTLTPTAILQSSEYLPYGLQSASSWTRENTTANNFLANSGTELNATSQLYDLDFRNYDPALGRMNQVDPMADKYGSLSPYHFSFNNPVRFSDPSGADPHWGLYTREDYYNADARIAGDQARNRGGGGGGGAVWMDDRGNLFTDENGNGVRDGGERNSNGWYRVTTYYAQDIHYYNEVDENGNTVDNMETVYSSESHLEYFWGDAQGIPGITVLNFGPETTDPNNLGVNIRLGYNDPKKRFSEYRWIQTVRTNLLGAYATSSPFNDSPGNGTPYYWEDDEMSTWTNIDSYSTMFFDSPGRAKNSESVFWSAELTIGGMKDGVFVPLCTMSYGFNINNGKLSITPLQVSQSTPWHLDSFTNKLKW